MSRPILLHTALSRIICQFYQLLDYISIRLPARLIEWKKRKTRCVRFEAFATTAHNGVFLSYQLPENEVSNHISNCLHVHDRHVFLFIVGSVWRPATLSPRCLILFHFANGVQMLDSTKGIFPYTWSTSTVDSCVPHSKSCGDWDRFEYLDIISTLSSVLPQENFTVNDRISTSLIDWTILCSEKKQDVLFAE